MIEIVHGDVLTARAKAVILAIDGTKQGMKAKIARAYARQWPDVWIGLDKSIDRDRCYG